MSYQVSNSIGFNHNNLSRSVDINSFIKNTNQLKSSFNDKRINQLKVTSEILGLNSRKEIYQKPIPIETINKFWGIDSKILQNDIIVQKQSFDQSYRNFWSFVDFNINIINKIHVESSTEHQQGRGILLNNDYRQNTQNSSALIRSRLDYAEARRRADELIKTGGSKKT